MLPLGLTPRFFPWIKINFFPLSSVALLGPIPQFSPFSKSPTVVGHPSAPTLSLDIQASKRTPTSSASLSLIRQSSATFSPSPPPLSTAPTNSHPSSASPASTPKSREGDGPQRSDNKRPIPDSSASTSNSSASAGKALLGEERPLIRPTSPSSTSGSGESLPEAEGVETDELDAESDEEQVADDGDNESDIKQKRRGIHNYLSLTGGSLLGEQLISADGAIQIPASNLG